MIYNKLIFTKWLAVTIMFSMAFIQSGFAVAENSEDLYEIGQLNVYKENVTLSGFSAGASMAIQTHMAHSSLFSGLAVFSQAFYHCGHRSLIEYGIRCSTRGFGLFPYSVDKSVDDAKEFSKNGLIDPLQNLANQRIFIWAGDLDIYIPSNMVAKNVDYYKNIGVNPNNIRYTLFTNATHLIPTDSYGKACNEDADDSLYLGNCAYPGPYHALSYILNSSSLIQQATPNLQQLKPYNQSAFYPEGNIRDVAMGTQGFIYIPKRCETEQKCLLHLNFHGCNEWPPQVAEQYIVHSGFLSVAEGNGIIMIFPLTTKVPQNMGGCWDFYSYTGPNFATKDGAQIKVIERILHRALYGK